MGTIINLRGTAGSGKTELVRRILARYGWPIAGEPVERPGRQTPLAWRLRHPAGRRPLLVLGHYGGTVGGCDTLRQQDGGLAGAFSTADDFAGAGHDVLLEGLHLSADSALTTALGARHSVHVLLLTTPMEDCAERLRRRWRAGRSARERLLVHVARQHSRIEAACAGLSPPVLVRHLGFDLALAEAAGLLGLELQSPASEP